MTETVHRCPSFGSSVTPCCNRVVYEIPRNERMTIDDAYVTCRLTEVARLRLPLPIRGMDRLAAYLENAYGKDLTMRQEGEWMVYEKPA